MAADPVLAVSHKPDGRQPLVEAERRVLEDCPELDAVLLLACLALPDAARREIAVFHAPAARADWTLWPPELGDELCRYVEVGEVADRLKQIGRALLFRAHMVSLLLRSRCVKYIVTTIVCFCDHRAHEQRPAAVHLHRAVPRADRRGRS